MALYKYYFLFLLNTGLTRKKKIFSQYLPEASFPTATKLSWTAVISVLACLEKKEELLINGCSSGSEREKKDNYAKPNCKK